MKEIECEMCPYLEFSYPLDHSWCDKVGGKHLMYGYCSDINTSKELPQKSNHRQQKHKLDRYHLNKKHKDNLKSKCKSSGFYSYAYQNGKYVKFTSKNKFLRKSCIRKARHYKQLFGKGNQYRKLTGQQCCCSTHIICKDKDVTLDRVVIDTYINNLQDCANPMFYDFVKLLKIHRFFQSLDRSEIEEINKEKEYNFLPTFSSNGITVAIDIYDENVMRVGIDPTECFNKASQCSILAYFPMSKRSYKAFKKLFLRLLDKKDFVRTEWMNISSRCWCGSYYEFGR